MLIPPHYQTLEVEQDVSPTDIRAAYRRLAKKYHPDTNAGDLRAADMFKRVTEAYKVLGDEKARRRYDKAYSIKSRAVKNKDGFQQNRTGGSVTIRLFLDLKEVMDGGVRKVSYKRRTVCKKCEGVGFVAGEDDCKECDGLGFTVHDYETKLPFPAGVRRGEKLSIAAEGHADRYNASPGDLAVLIEYKPHKYFNVDGADLVHDTLIGLDTYVDGGRAKIPTITGGSQTVSIKPRHTDGEKVVLEGRGLPARNGSKRGDMVIVVKHCLPKKLSRKEKEMVKQLMHLPGFKLPSDEVGLIPREMD